MTDQGFATARIVETRGPQHKEVFLPTALLAVSDVEISLQLWQDLVVEQLLWGGGGGSFIE